MADIPTAFWGLTKIEVGAHLDTWGTVVNDNMDLIDALLNRVCPVGSVLPFGGVTAPAGWHLCQGQQIATASYPKLFAALGYTYGGAGALFAVPNLQGRVPLMAGSGSDVLGVPFSFAFAAVGGVVQHILGVPNLPAANLISDVTGSHQHPGFAEPIGHGHTTDPAGAHAHDVGEQPLNVAANSGGGAAFFGGDGSFGLVATHFVADHQHTIPESGVHAHIVSIGFDGGHGHNVPLGGASQPFPNVQPYVALNYIIWGGTT